MTDSSLFGLDTVFKTIEKDVKRKSDIIMAFVHWNLTKQGFRAIGIGDEVSSLLLFLKFFRISPILFIIL